MQTSRDYTFSGFWPMTKENTYFGYKISEELYEWWKTKKTALKHLPYKTSSLLRGTLIKDKMYINLIYLNPKRK